MGRLVMPFVCHAAKMVRGDVACPGCGSCLLLSDDAGVTWRYGAVSAQEGTREASPVQLRAAPSAKGAKLWLTERSMGNETGARMRAGSEDGGESFAFAEYGRDDVLPDGVVSGGVLGDAGMMPPRGQVGRMREVHPL